MRPRARRRMSLPGGSCVHSGAKPTMHIPKGGEIQSGRYDVQPEAASHGLRRETVAGRFCCGCGSLAKGGKWAERKRPLGMFEHSAEAPTRLRPGRSRESVDPPNKHFLYTPLQILWPWWSRCLENRSSEPMTVPEVSAGESDWQVLLFFTIHPPYT